MNYYEILQVSSAASHEMIQMAYQTLQNQYHIESLQGDKKYAELKMQQLDEAYRVLSSPILRQQYDNMLRMGDAQNSLAPQVPQQTKQTVPSRKRVFPALLAILLVVVAAAGLLLYKYLNNKPDKISSAVSVVSLDEYKEIVTNYGLTVYIYPEEMQKFGNAEVYATNFGGPYSKWPDQECMVVYYAIHPDHDMALHEENIQLSVQEDDVAKWVFWTVQCGQRRMEIIMPTQK